MDPNHIAQHYDGVYLAHEVPFGNSGEPQELVGSITGRIESGRVLDLGAGQGRNGLWLARQGFEVEAWDISSVAVESMNRRGKQERLPFSAVLRDAREESWDNYDVVIATYLLHHLNWKDAISVIGRAQNHTMPNGLNVITAFTNSGDLAAEKNATESFFPEPAVFERLYARWEIIVLKDRCKRVRATTPQGGAMWNSVASLVARKPSHG